MTDGRRAPERAEKIKQNKELLSVSPSPRLPDSPAPSGVSTLKIDCESSGMDERRDRIMDHGVGR